jgi:hypothetical protein
VLLQSERFTRCHPDGTLEIHLEHPRQRELAFADVVWRVRTNHKTKPGFKDITSKVSNITITSETMKCVISEGHDGLGFKSI